MKSFSSIAETLRSAFAATDELDPDEQDRIYQAVLSHVRARRPESVGFLGRLPEPGEPIRDPREPRG